MAQESRSRALVIKRHPRPDDPVRHGVQDFPEHRRLQGAVPLLHDAVGAGRVKPDARRAVLSGQHRVLRLVAVAGQPVAGHDRAQQRRRVRHPSDPGQAVLHVLPLILQLRLVGDMAPDAAAAAAEGCTAVSLYAIGRRLQQLLDASVGTALLHLNDPAAHDIPHRRHRDKHHHTGVSVLRRGASYAVSGCRNAGYGQHDALIFDETHDFHSRPKRPERRSAVRGIFSPAVFCVKLFCFTC